MKPDKPHDSMRGHFVYYLYEAMEKNPNIYVVTADLGYGMFDSIRDDFPTRFINVGASEQAGMGVAVGLALNGRIPFFYSITPFALYRAFETIRNYINHENIPVKIIGGGRDKDYAHDGISHWSEDASKVLDIFDNIEQHWPEEKREMATLVTEILDNNKPTFVSLKR